MKKRLDSGLNSANVELAIEDFKSLFESSFSTDIVPHREFAKLVKDNTFQNKTINPRKRRSNSIRMGSVV